MMRAYDGELLWEGNAIAYDRANACVALVGLSLMN
jgi:hypothetical protein